MLPAVDHRVEERVGQTRPAWELADIFRQYGEAYRRSHRLAPMHLKVMRDIELCRTASLGGHIERCDTCGFERKAYCSCRNRHCPKCQGLVKARWLEARKAELLPVTYFHNVFTLPHELNPLTLSNKEVIFDMLFRSVSGTLLHFGKNPENGLGGKLGFSAILHSWDQTLMDHFHLHCVIAAGVLSFDHSRWTAAGGDFLFHVKALSRVFRGKFMDHLEEAYAKGQLLFAGNTRALGTRKGFCLLKEQLWEKDWVVYSKKPFAGPEQVLDYLGRYTHRVAISNHRIVDGANGAVTFRYTDRKDKDKLKEMTLSSQEFIRRFLLHVLPDGFMRIRHFGFLANRCKKRDLGRSRELLGLCAELPQIQEKSTEQWMLELTGVDVTRCPVCKAGTMKVVAALPKAPPEDFANSCIEPQILDSS